MMINQLFSLSAGLYTPESDVCRRQIITYKGGPRTDKITICIVALNP